MSDSKSKLPDLKEITSMAGKLFNDIKKSVNEIVADYKKNHSNASGAPRKAAASKTKTTTAKSKKSEKD